eukprot:CAMPEP_0185911574 /NCGR_PEP_ID=MMETSP0196C-20130402/30588_1 /TAXON_ID=2932 /ORGANISM="Alexandrium fundyense, Strain CCMP1719" /LENGTH=48 /DNA_ID= /DNA_START= /DNA_END= /DNA_ORIENTATION=
MDTGYGSDVSVDDWPDRWMDAQAHAGFIAKLMDNDTVYNFLHATSGAS